MKNIVVFFLVVLGLAHGSDVDLGDVLYLTDTSFEHDTQAASGQTSGIWLVLFANADTASERAELALKALASKTNGVPLFAKVDVEKSPKTAERFSATNPPVVKLFRERRMFSYSGDYSEQSIEEFYEEGWRQASAEVVPKEPGFLEHLFSDKFQAVALVMLIAGTGLFFLIKPKPKPLNKKNE